MASEEIAPEFRLHRFQRQVLGDLFAALSEPTEDLSRRVVAHLPTGAGKTRIASHAASRLQNTWASEGQIVTWLAASEELCVQAAETLKEAWTHLGNREVSLHRYWGSYSLDLEELDEGFLVASLAKLRARNRTDHGVMIPIAERSAGVVFDEAHQATASTYRFVTEQLATYAAPVIGLTATPGRNWRTGEEDRSLAEMFGRRKVGIDPRGHPSPVTYLVKNHYLADAEFISVQIESDSRIADPTNDSDYRAADLDALGRDGIRNLAIVDLTERVLRRHRRVLVFAPSVSSAEETASTLSERGHTAAAVTATTDRFARQELLRRFKSDTSERMALFNYGVLTTGFDAPKTSCVVVARPTTSLVLFSQMIGRAMRGPLSGGNAQCEIYSVVDTKLPGFGSVADAFENWEEMWITQTTN